MSMLSVMCGDNSVYCRAEGTFVKYREQWLTFNRYLNVNTPQLGTNSSSHSTLQAHIEYTHGRALERLRKWTEFGEMHVALFYTHLSGLFAKYFVILASFPIVGKEKVKRLRRLLQSTSEFLV